MHQLQRRGITTLILAILTVTVTAAVYAQGPGGPHGGPPTAAQELARLQKQLILTEEESAAILPILEKRHTEIDALMQSSQSSNDRAAIGSQMHTIMDTTNKQIRELLTEAQQKIFDAMRPPKPPTTQGSSDSDHEAPPSNDSGGAPPAQN